MSVSFSGFQIDTYRVLELLGTGGMGEVYLAIDDADGHKVALKLLSEEHRDNAELRARFLREASAIAAVSHPNVVQVLATGEFEGRPYLAMEYLAGKDLGSLVDQSGPLGSLAVATVLCGAASALGAAAEVGLVHRDVKPTNLMWLDDGVVKVTDFGLAKPVGPSAEPALTALGVVMGTPDYIAPEQARGEELDARADIYALGCTAFFLLTGRPPFRTRRDDAKQYMRIIARHVSDPAPDARGEMPQTDAELAELILGMMAKERQKRPAYAAILMVAENVRARLRGAPSLAMPVLPYHGEPSPPPQVRRRWIPALVSLLAIASTVSAALLAARWLR